MIKSVTSILTTLAFIGFLTGCNPSNDWTEAYEPLNVLLITADDLNYNSVGVYGNTIPNITPNIDKLAAQGMLFNHGFVNIAVCQPSRQSIMTGRYAHNNGARGFEPIDRDVATLQEELNKVGYLNAIIGKERHLKPMDKYYWDYVAREEDVASGLGIGRDPNLYYQHTSAIIAKAKKENKPFFLMANSHDPHRPFAGSDSEKRVWGEDLPKFTREIKPEDVVVPAFLFDLPEVRKEVAEYYTSVHRCDQTVGAILKALEDSGLSDNTIVMFISDNGMSVPFAKSNTYLNSNKTPWIIRWPGQIKGGSVDSEHFISGIDYMPTILHALHLSEVPNMDGKSFLPILQGKKQKNRSTVFTEYHKIFAGIKYPMRGVQNEQYGYIVNFWSDGKHEVRGDAMSGRTFKAMAEAAETNEAIAKRVDLYKYRVPEELYDYKNDPDGLVNLINDPGMQEELERLKGLLFREMRRTSDPIKDEFQKGFMQ
jgi:N-sulfoglucosamine sulfohydrolase